MTVKTPKERPILFSAPMVRATLDGRKTQTRQRIRCQSDLDFDDGWPLSEDECGVWARISCPYGQRGDRLWVRESFRFGRGYDGIKSSEVPKEDYVPVWYEADAPHSDVSVGAWVLGRYRPSVHMPRAFSRITLEITDIRVERLQDISRGDAMAEGIYAQSSVGDDASADLWGWGEYRYGTPQLAYMRLWESINGAGSWDANPWVWVIGFEPVGRHNVTP